jgi:predicted Zn-dependent peptidase
VKRLIKEKFGKIKKGGKIDPINIVEEPFQDREVVDLVITPYRMARMGYRTVKPNHPDAVVIDLIKNMFNNSSRTGFLDKLNAENKILSAFAWVEQI